MKKSILLSLVLFASLHADCYYSLKDIRKSDPFIVGSNFKLSASVDSKCLEDISLFKSNRFIRKSRYFNSNALLPLSQKVVIQYGDFIFFEFDGKLVSNNRDSFKIQSPNFKVKKIFTEGYLDEAN